MKNPKYVTKEAIEGLVTKIGVPAPDEFSQDWEYEVSDASRIEEFLFAYEHVELNEDEKFTLMIIVISSYDDALAMGNFEMEWDDTISSLLLKDINIHESTIFYWAMQNEEELENCFCVTPLMRKFIESNQLKCHEE